MSIFINIITFSHLKLYIAILLKQMNERANLTFEQDGLNYYDSDPYRVLRNNDCPLLTP